MDGPIVAVRKNWHAGNLPSKEGNNTEALSELYGDDMTSSKTCSTRSKCSFQIAGCPQKCSFQIAGCPQTPDRELKLISDDPSVFFPVDVRFTSPRTFCNIKVASVNKIQNGDDVKFTARTQLITDKYQVFYHKQLSSSI